MTEQTQQSPAIFGKYQILEELGRGGFGIVYKAIDQHLDREVALKVLYPNLVNDSSFVTRFRQEARIAAKLDHPNLVPVHDFGQQDGNYYIAMGYMPGGSLKELLQKQGKLEPQTAYELLEQVGSAMSYAHGKGIIHRDLKPGNILLDENGKARVADLGFAKVLSEGASRSMSASGSLVGTPAYMAPEVWRNKPATPQTDIYSLGCILYEMLTGKVLFEGESPAEVITKHVVDGPEYTPELPEELRAVLDKALQRNTADRFASVQEFEDALLEANKAKTSNRTDRSETEKVRAGFQEKEEAKAITKELANDKAVPDPTKPPVEAKVKPIKEKLTEKSGAKNAGWYAAAGLGLLVVIMLFIVLRERSTPKAPATSSLASNTAIASATVTKTATPTTTKPATKTPTQSPTKTATLLPSSTAIPPTATQELGVGSTLVSPIDGMVMVYVPAGEFRMGSGWRWIGHYDDQVHTIYLDEYWIDQTEVTNAMYAKCVAAGACTEPGLPSSKTRSSYYGDSSYEDYPVIYVNWNQANSYCQWADRDLPTEAQWEKSARAEDQRMYPWGNNSPSESLVNYGFLVGDTAEVGSYPEGSSPYGVLDMAGNVEEWVADWYDPIYYTRSPKNNPTGPASGEYRVVRGGGWSSDYRLYSYLNPKISSVYRSGVRPDYDSDNLGFRCSYSP